MRIKTLMSDVGCLGLFSFYLFGKSIFVRLYIRHEHTDRSERHVICNEFI